MTKMIAGTLVMALASLGWAAPQTNPTPGAQTEQTTKHTGKKSAKHMKRSPKKPTPPAATQK